MEKPSIYEIVKTVSPLLVLSAISTLALTFKARKEVLERNDWTCQNPNCIGIEETGFPRSFRSNAENGNYMVQGSHKPLEHRSSPDSRTGDHVADCRCTFCHAGLHVQMGQENEAKLLLRTQTIRNINELRDRAENQTLPLKDARYYDDDVEIEQVRQWVLMTGGNTDLAGEAEMYKYGEVVFAVDP